MTKAKSSPKTSFVTALRMYEAKDSFALMALGTLTGLAAGLAAVLLQVAVDHFEEVRNQFAGTWPIILFPAVGAGLGIFIQRNLLADKAGHGVPDVIKSVTMNKGILSRRMLVSRLISSFLTVGAGGAAGLEGPIVVSGGAAGSAVASFFNLSERKRILLIACGTSGAIGAIFNAPLTGLVFSLEVILGEWKSRNLIPTVISAAVATQFSRYLMGHKIPFHHGDIMTTFLDLPSSMLLGILCALTGWLFVRSLGAFGVAFKRIHLPFFLKAALGGLAVGCVGYFHSDAMGEGYHLIDLLIRNDFHAGFWVLGLVFVLRLFTSSMTLSSGGSGGVFAPALFFGSALGYLFGQLLEKLSRLGHFASPGAYSLIGMAGLVAGVMSAPLTGLFLIFEISDSYSLILPLMVCALTSMLVYRLLEQGSLYTHDLILEDSVRFRGTGLHLLTEIEDHEVISACATLPRSSTMKDFLIQCGATLPDQVALVDEDGHFAGLVFLEAMKPVLLDTSLHRVVTMESLVERNLPELHIGFRPDQALIQFGMTDRAALPVIQLHGEFVGIVTKEEFFDSIRREMLVQE